jgi:hypothetical protein
MSVKHILSIVSTNSVSFLFFCPDNLFTGNSSGFMSHTIIMLGSVYDFKSNRVLGFVFNVIGCTNVWHIYVKNCYFLLMNYSLFKYEVTSFSEVYFSYINIATPACLGIYMLRRSFCQLLPSELMFVFVSEMCFL